MDLDSFPIHGEQPINLRQELGIMFGFLAACILTVAVYYIFWQASQHRAAARDEVRRKDLRARGFHHERGGYHDKALHRYASRDPIAQTQGQTLEFLTEPDQVKNEKHNLNNNNHSDDGISDSNTIISREKQVDSGMSGTTAAGTGLRINTHEHESLSGKGNSLSVQNGSAVSNRTPLSMMHASAGQSAKDMF
ncbi:hypothetical protein TMatcc_002614 [Talaromyces marneffei ATCC 18224]|uniref:Uncharacterized protein n=2 Tax=Talaromyces marneffei TaxID=37727 RepID=B6Q2S4_TALMQ|nr:uncharacterized protein EYB26_002279 [Talaromyces marneffei]EEA29022.1 hypothetical protein PMAA_038060 [Talaromyces marneffei ATCC 18224]KAE8555380.1 hypothetical protein EYB25_000075 [Talaromyces marneffei]QGA14623.1 hypothetical protein EYB26_002279 [Talaromyces marneffei]